MLLESIAASVDPAERQIPMADLLDLGTGGAAGLEATLNVLDLVTAAAAAATGANGATVPRAGIDLGPLAGVDATVDIIAPPKVACGGSRTSPRRGRPRWTLHSVRRTRHRARGDSQGEA